MTDNNMVTRSDYDKMKQAMLIWGYAWAMIWFVYGIWIGGVLS